VDQGADSAPTKSCNGRPFSPKSIRRTRQLSEVALAERVASSRARASILGLIATPWSTAPSRILGRGRLAALHLHPGGSARRLLDRRARRRESGLGAALANSGGIAACDPLGGVSIDGAKARRREATQRRGLDPALRRPSLQNVDCDICSSRFPQRPPLAAPGSPCSAFAARCGLHPLGLDFSSLQETGRSPPSATIHRKREQAVKKWGLACASIGCYRRNHWATPKAAVDGSIVGRLQRGGVNSVLCAPEEAPEPSVSNVVAAVVRREAMRRACAVSLLAPRDSRRCSYCLPRERQSHSIGEGQARQCPRPATRGRL
jgi:hypothetical protein